MPTPHHRSLRVHRFITTLVTALVASCGRPVENEPVPSTTDPAAIPASTPVALVGVRVIPMTSNTVLDAQTVVIRDGVIAAIGPRGSVQVPNDAVVIAGNGRYVMPALVDMHVHLNIADLDAYVDAGIGTVRNMWGHSGIATMQRDIAAGTRRGPTIVSASPGVDGSPPQWPGTLLVTSAADARAIVRAQRDAGWPYLKVYTRLSRESFDSVMVAARSVGIPALGHVPLDVDITHAIEMGMRSIEHLTGYDRAVSRSARSGTWAWIDADVSRFAALTELSAQSGVWNCPTLAIYAELAKQHTAAERETIIRNRRLFVRELVRAGAKILLGTDAGIDVVAPGVSVHAELRELVAAGLTPFDALRAGTTSAAEFLGLDVGRVVVGARADLLVLRANPLADVANARRVDGMILRGAWRRAP
ncbi:MAG TPA: amidohydrolase family protein [Gemmatimonadaceae bacterium]|nr:amidohydrolase family protein [Gemmatimonadaceae bacterium]